MGLSALRMSAYRPLAVWHRACARSLGPVLRKAGRPRRLECLRQRPARPDRLCCLGQAPRQLWATGTEVGLPKDAISL